jgi:hypothetical protein
MIDSVNKVPTPIQQPIKPPAAVPVKAETAQTKAPARQEATPVKAETAATVELSQQAQAQLLRQQGMGIPQIALQLRLDVKTVTSFFPLSETQS